MTLRSTVAADTDCMPYMIANNKTLLEMARVRPSDKAQLAKGESFFELGYYRSVSCMLMKSDKCDVTRFHSLYCHLLHLIFYIMYYL